MPVLPAGSNAAQIYPTLVDYHMRSEPRPDNVINLGGSCSECESSDGQRGRRGRKEQTDQLSLLFVSLHYSEQDWGFLFSVSHRAKRKRPPFSEGVSASERLREREAPQRSHACATRQARLPCITPHWHTSNQDNSQHSRGVRRIAPSSLPD